MKKRLVIFDLDGTLNRTELYSVPSYKKAMEKYNVEPKADETIISTYGATYIDSAKVLIGTDDPIVAKEFSSLVGEYERDYIKDFHASYNDVPKMLESLKNSDYKTAICSNSSERYIKMVLNALGIFEYIDYIQPLVPSMTKKDTLAILLNKVLPEAAIMVGDRIYDKEAAYENKIPFIGCLYGYCRKEVEDADIAVQNPIEIIEAVKKLIG